MHEGSRQLRYSKPISLQLSPEAPLERSVRLAGARTLRSFDCRPLRCFYQLQDFLSFVPFLFSLLPHTLSALLRTNEHADDSIIGAQYYCILLAMHVFARSARERSERHATLLTIFASRLDDAVSRSGCLRAPSLTVVSSIHKDLSARMT
jgi:hypothetical protein